MPNTDEFVEIRLGSKIPDCDLDSEAMCLSWVN